MIKITKQTIKEYKEVESNYFKKKDHIEYRIDEIIEKIIREVFGYTGERKWNWYFDGAGENDIGPLRFSSLKEGVESVGYILLENIPDLDLFRDIWNGEIPVDYLYSDSYIEELKNKINELRKNKIDNKTKRKKYFEKKKKIDALLKEERKRLMKELD